MFKHLFPTVCMVTLLITINTWSADIVTGPYFGQTPPGTTPQKLILPAIDSLPDFLDSRVAFSPDGNECFFSGYKNWSTPGAYMYYSQCVDNIWTIPQPAPLLQPPGQGCSHPFYSTDGNTLYFTKNNNIWAVERTTQGWGTPHVLPAPINTSAYEGTYSQTIDGTAYLVSVRAGGRGKADVWQIHPAQNGQARQAESLGPTVNSSADDGSPFVSPDGKILLFASNRLVGNYKDNLYVAFSDDTGGWTEAINLDQYCPGINTDQQEYAPKFSSDGRYLFFTRMDYNTQQGGVYWVENPIPRPDPNGPVRNLNTQERYNSIQAAVIFAQDSDVIVIDPGIYQELIDLTGKTLSLQSVDPNNPAYIGGTIIQGRTDNPVIILQSNSRDCEIAGLTIRAGSIGIKGTETNATIRNCRIMDNVTHGMELFQSSSPVLKNCLITANGQTGIKMHPPTGPNEAPCTPTIDNCTIVDNGDGAIDGGEPTIIDSITD